MAMETVVYGSFAYDYLVDTGWKCQETFELNGSKYAVMVRKVR